MTIHARTPKILGLLLTYPSADLIEACEEMRILLREEGWLSEEMLAGLEPLLTYLQETDLLDLQEEYVALFDRTPSLSLHLFEHVHGDSRDRGQALVDLHTLYQEKGLYNDSEHTPDYLPLFLEYLSLLPPAQAREDLGGAINVIGALAERLKNRESHYASVCAALREISVRRPNEALLKKAIETDPGMPLSPEEMDAAWEEQFAFADHQNQQGGGGCPKAEDMLKKMEAQS